MTMTSPACRRDLRPEPGRLILAPVATPPRWLREHRRIARAVAGPEPLVAEVARLVEAERRRRPEIKPVEWGMFRDIPDDEWEPCSAALEAVKGRPLLR